MFFIHQKGIAYMAVLFFVRENWRSQFVAAVRT